MPRVTFVDQGKAADFPAGKTLLSAALEMGIDVSHVCGGDGACGTCRIEGALTNLCALLPESALRRHRGRLDRLADDRFAGIQWDATPQGAVVLHGAPAVLECSLYEEVPAGEPATAPNLTGLSLRPRA